ncbi:hypothetical protein Scep_003533 [Stephania cephalantha]|uniref:UspA domain-containing protein n=1 Tax=Stephania cephalantha TaxID=152367 RepID=A0AAP0KT86_9MAGN
MDEEKEEQVQVQQNYSASILNKKKRVMVAIDENETSFHALQWTLDYLFPSSATTATAAPQPEHHKEETEELGSVILLHVFRSFQNLIIPIVTAGPTAAACYEPSFALVESAKKAQEQNSAMLLSKASKLCKNRPVKVETMTKEGEPKEIICEVVEHTHPDLLILGSRGLGKLKRVVLGSVSDYCAHHAKCPVLIVKT